MAARGALLAAGAALLAVALTVGQPTAQVGAQGHEAALTGAAEVGIGGHHTCALLNNGRVRCWGDNQYGQLGDGTNNPSPTAVLVRNPANTGPLTNVAELTVGGDFNCARLVNGQARCWGRNSGGGLGNNTTADSTLPVIVANSAGNGPLVGVAQISAGSAHACAKLNNGVVKCWGWNDGGQQGDNSTLNNLVPATVLNATGAGPLANVAEIAAAGGARTCARLNNGQARCWGFGFAGQLGDGSTVNRLLPVPVSNPNGTAALTNVAQLSESGELHNCAVLVNQTVRCWGWNHHAQVGDGTGVSRSRPVTVLNATGAGMLTNVTEIAPGGGQTCALLVNDTIRCWGLNVSGELGDGTTTSRTLPVTVRNSANTGPLTNVAQIAAAGTFFQGIGFTNGTFHTCAVLNTGTVKCWGNNAFGQLGDGTGTNRPLPVTVQL